MNVVVGEEALEITKSDGSDLVIFGSEVVTVDALKWKQYNTIPPELVADNPYQQLTPTSVNRYKVVLSLSDNRQEQIFMGDVGGQVTWTDDVTGVNQAVYDISLMLGGGGPVIAFTLSSGSVSGDYVFAQVGNAPLGPTALIWTQVGGDPDTDFVAVGGGLAYVWSGGVEQYLSLSPGPDPLLPQDYTDWTLGAGGANPTPTFS